MLVKFSVNRIFKSRAVSKTVKINPYKSMIEPVVIYVWKEDRIWPFSETEMIMLNMWERKLLRRLYGPVMGNEYGKIKTSN